MGQWTWNRIDRGSSSSSCQSTVSPSLYGLCKLPQAPTVRVTVLLPRRLSPPLRRTMEVSNRKRERSPSIRNSFHPKKSKINSCSTDETFLQLLDFSALDNISAISDRFDQVANALLHNHMLVVRCGEMETEFRILELEFYLQKHKCHEDPFTHGSEEQKIRGRWCAFNFPSFTYSQMKLDFSLGTSTARPDGLQIFTVVRRA